MTSLNLFSTKFHEVVGIIEKRADLEYAIFDTPGQIEAFAVEQLFQSHINSDLAKIYTRMIYPEMVDERIARVLPKLLYARRITCDNPDMRQVVLCYEEMKGETTVSLRGGRAYQKEGSTAAAGAADEKRPFPSSYRPGNSLSAGGR